MAVTFAVLASGTGSNFAAIADAIQTGVIPDAKLIGLIGNVAGAPVFDKARSRGIPSVYIDGKMAREAYDQKLVATLQGWSADYILLAGYMRILSAKVLAPFPNQVINIHPSLLPSFPGLHAVKQALEHGVRWTGVTVHFVTEALDAGPIIEQNVVEVLPSDNEESLYERIRPIEHKTYIRALQKLGTSRFQLLGRRLLFSPNEIE